MKTLTVKKLDIMSYAGILGLIGTMIGLVIGVFFAIGLLLTASFGNNSNSGLMIGLSIATIILAPLFYGIMTFAIGIVQAFIFNLALKFSKGLKIEIE